MQEVSGLDRFSRRSFYVDLNRRLVDLLPLKSAHRCVDVGCGTGAVTKLILERVTDGEVIAVDPSLSALETAKRNLQNIGSAVVRFLEGGSENLSNLVKRAADVVTFCNGIHLVEDKAKALREVHGSLRKGGTFAFNTAFFEGCQPRETLPFYTAWVRKALKLFRERYPNVQRQKEERAQARIQLSADEYRGLLEGGGFRVKHMAMHPVPITMEAFQDISDYEVFARGALPGVPLEIATPILQETVAEVYKEMHLETVPRLWLEVVAERV